jgi:CheY-like chemotaxis protein
MLKTVLIVEDNEMNRELFTLLVNSLGCKILQAKDGEEGVRVAKENNIDLILMDIQMPKMDGITALKLLRSDDRTRDIPVIALTSYAMKGDKERYLEYGFSDYITKPIEKKQFLNALKSILDI